MKLRFSFSIFLSLIILSIGSNAATAVDYQDFRTPIIEDIKQNYSAVYENGENFLEINYEMKVKTFSNPLAGANFSYVYPYKDYPVGCQLIPTNWGSLTVSYGDNASKLDSLIQPLGLVKVDKFNGYQLETHNFTFTTKAMRGSLNTKFKFCDQLLKLEMVNLWDTAGHSNSINYNHSNYFGPFYNTYPEIPYQSFKELFSQKQLPVDFCQKLSVPYTWYTSENLFAVCNHSASLATLSISLSPSQNELARAAADKAAALNKEMNETFIALTNNLNKYKTDIDQIFRDYPAYFNQTPELRSSLQRALDYKIPTVASQSGIDAIRDLIGGGSGSALASDFLLAQAGITKYVALENIKAKTAKRTTITCVKGKLSKKVSAVNPKCPAGYKVKK